MRRLAIKLADSVRQRPDVVRRVAVTTCAVGLALLLTGCAAGRAYSQAEREMRRKDYDRAVLSYSKAVALDPGNSRYEVALARAKIKAGGDHFRQGQRFHMAQQYERAIAEYQQTLLLTPDNQHAQVELERAMRQWAETKATPSQIEEEKRKAREKDLGPPRLAPKRNIAINFKFEEAELGKIFDAISKASGINFVFDDKVDLEKPRTIDLGNVTLEQALDILMLQTKNFYQPINEYTLLIAPDTRQKRQEYEDQVIRTFFLSNAETKTIISLLRSLLQSRQIAENPELNSITIKDTPSKVAIGEMIVNANDKAKGEVIVDVELLEINRTLTRTLGLDLTTRSLSLSFNGGDENGNLPLNGLSALRQTGNFLIGPVPGVILNFLKSDSDSRQIAQPQLRVTEGEQAEILIGERVPIPTTSFNTGNTIGTNVVPITSFTYQNVGITVQVEPRVHHNKEVTLQVQVEVSGVTGQVDAGGGISQPIIGTRQIQTVIRLRDGETNLLAGLIQRNDQDSQSGVSGLSDIPGLGRLFSTNDITNSETDIILTLTPRIIRIPNIRAEDMAAIWVGTEEQMELRGPARNALNVSAFSGLPVALDQNGDPTGALVDTATAADDAGDATADAADDATPAGEDAPDPTGDRPTDSTDQNADRPTARDQRDDGDTADSRRNNRRGSRDRDDNDLDRNEPQGQTFVQLQTAKASYSIGEQIQVTVLLNNGINVGSVPFHLNYNADVLTFLPPGVEGPVMQSDGTNTVFLARDTGSSVVVGMSRMGGGDGVNGSGVIATFNFLAKAPGQANFAFSDASVKDPQARNIGGAQFIGLPNPVVVN